MLHMYWKGRINMECEELFPVVQRGITGDIKERNTLVEY